MRHQDPDNYNGCQQLNKAIQRELALRLKTS
jgi:hypothetical protein